VYKKNVRESISFVFVAACNFGRRYGQGEGLGTTDRLVGLPCRRLGK